MHIHTAQARKYTTRQDISSDTYPKANTLAAMHAHARAHTHTPYVKTKAATLAELRRYAFKYNGSAIDTRPGKNTHAHTTATLA